eukprot:COSAG02_NODE_67_length_42609_cov_14.506681_4_plen_71_part_00
MSLFGKNSKRMVIRYHHYADAEGSASHKSAIGDFGWSQLSGGPKKFGYSLATLGLQANNEARLIEMSVLQ